MASGLPHPVLLAPLAGLDSITINGEVVNFSHVFYTWIAMAILFTFAFLVRGQIKLVPGKLQNVFEVIIGGLEDFVVSNIGEDGRKIYHVLAALFLFIITMNLMGLIPGFDAPTANVNTNAAMALFTFGYYNWIGIRRWGAGSSSTSAVLSGGSLL